MRMLRWLALAAGMAGGLLGFGMAADAAPMPVAASVFEQAAATPAPTVQKAYYYGRRFYGPRRFYGRRFYGPRFYGRRFYRRPYFYRRPFYRRRFFY